MNASKNAYFNAFSVSIHGLSFSHPHSSFLSDKFERANVHGFYAIHGVYGARIDRSRDSFQDGGRKRAATTFRRMADRETERNRSQPFNVSALSSAIYHHAYITAAGSRNFELFFLRMYRYAWDSGAWNHEIDPQNNTAEIKRQFSLTRSSHWLCVCVTNLIHFIYLYFVFKQKIF